MNTEDSLITCTGDKIEKLRELGKGLWIVKISDCKYAIATSWKNIRKLDFDTRCDLQIEAWFSRPDRIDAGADSANSQKEWRDAARNAMLELRIPQENKKSWFKRALARYKLLSFT